MVTHPFPAWTYFPPRDAPPAWVEELIGVVTVAKPAIDSRSHTGVNSDSVLAEIRPGLLGLGYRVEAGKKRNDKIQLPVLFGEHGVPPFHYEVDAFHESLGILVEIEAGRGWTNGAFYRDLIRGSLIVGARYLAIGVMLEYRGGGGKQQDYRLCRDQLEAIYASNRLQLPLEGVLLFGY